MHVKKIAQEVLQKSHDADSQFESYAKDSVDEVFAAVNAGELIWTQFHKIRTAEEVKGKWTSFLLSLEIKGRSISINLLHQYLLRTVLLTLILELCKGDESESKEKAKQAHLSDHDMQVIRYIAGFVPFSLIKNTKKLSQNKAGTILTS